jgi:hypothetical protein
LKSFEADFISVLLQIPFQISMEIIFRVCIFLLPALCCYQSVQQTALLPRNENLKANVNDQHTPYTLSCNNPHLSELADQHEFSFPELFFFSRTEVEENGHWLISDSFIL